MKRWNENVTLPLFNALVTSVKIEILILGNYIKDQPEGEPLLVKKFCYRLSENVILTVGLEPDSSHSQID